MSKYVNVVYFVHDEWQHEFYNLVDNSNVVIVYIV